MKQWMIQWMILAAIMAISSAMVLTSCKEDEDELLVTDDKPWTISSDDMDTTVKPGDKLYLKPEERTHIW